MEEDHLSSTTKEESHNQQVEEAVIPPLQEYSTLQEELLALIEALDSDKDNDEVMTKTAHGLRPDSTAVKEELAIDTATATIRRSAKKTNNSLRSMTAEDVKPSQTRIRTYTARKKEIEALLQELPHLEAYVDYLKQQAANANNDTNSMQKKQLVNAHLRQRAIQNQYLLARVQSSMTLYTIQQQQLIPCDQFIHLRIDMTQRVDTLIAIKPRILRDTKRLMTERSWYLNLGTPCTDQTSYVTPEGDFCTAKFMVMPLEGVTSVKVVYDKLLYYLANMEIVISEETSDVTIREDSEQTERQGITHHRLLQYIPIGVQVESNHVMFAEYDPNETEFDCDGREVGVVALMTVDRDDLYPYRPTERLRQDITSMTLIKTYKRTYQASKHQQHREEKWEVALIHTHFVKLHHSTHGKVAREVMEVARDRLAKMSDVVFSAVRASLTH